MNFFEKMIHRIEEKKQKQQAIIKEMEIQKKKLNEEIKILKINIIDLISKIKELEHQLDTQPIELIDRDLLCVSKVDLDELELHYDQLQEYLYYLENSIYYNNLVIQNNKYSDVPEYFKNYYKLQSNPHLKQELSKFIDRCDLKQIRILLFDPNYVECIIDYLTIGKEVFNESDKYKKYEMYTGNLEQSMEEFLNTLLSKIHELNTKDGYNLKVNSQIIFDFLFYIYLEKRNYDINKYIELIILKSKNDSLFYIFNLLFDNENISTNYYEAIESLPILFLKYDFGFETNFSTIKELIFIINPLLKKYRDTDINVRRKITEDIKKIKMNYRINALMNKNRYKVPTISSLNHFHKYLSDFYGNDKIIKLIEELDNQRVNSYGCVSDEILLYYLSILGDYPDIIVKSLENNISYNDYRDRSNIEDIVDEIKKITNRNHLEDANIALDTIFKIRQQLIFAGFPVGSNHQLTFILIWYYYMFKVYRNYRNQILELTSNFDSNEVKLYSLYIILESHSFYPAGGSIFSCRKTKFLSIIVGFLLDSGIYCDFSTLTELDNLLYRSFNSISNKPELLAEEVKRLFNNKVVELHNDESLLSWLQTFPQFKLYQTESLEKQKHPTFFKYLDNFNDDETLQIIIYNYLESKNFNFDFLHDFEKLKNYRNEYKANIELGNYKILLTEEEDWHDGPSILNDLNNVLVRQGYNDFDLHFEYFRYGYVIKKYKNIIEESDLHFECYDSLKDTLFNIYNQLDEKMLTNDTYQVLIAYFLYDNKLIEDFSTKNEIERIIFSYKKEYDIQELENQLLKSKKTVEKETMIFIDNLDLLSGYDFEYFLADFFIKMGYKVKATDLSGDQGADLIVYKNNYSIAVQAKRYANKVTNKAIQEVIAGKLYYNTDSALVVTTNYFTSSAIELANKTGVQLWDRTLLIEKLSEYNMI